MTWLFSIILSFTLLLHLCNSYTLSRPSSHLTATALYPRQATQNLCDPAQQQAIEEALRALNWILFLANQAISHPLGDTFIGRRFVFHFGRRTTQYRTRVWTRLHSIRAETNAHPGGAPIFCEDVEQRCDDVPGSALYLDMTGSFIVLVRYLVLCRPNGQATIRSER